MAPLRLFDNAFSPFAFKVRAAFAGALTTLAVGSARR